MVLFRLLVLLTGLGIAVLTALYLLSGQRRYLRIALVLLKIVIACGLIFFAILALERIA